MRKISLKNILKKTFKKKTKQKVKKKSKKVKKINESGPYGSVCRENRLIEAGDNFRPFPPIFFSGLGALGPSGAHFGAPGPPWAPCVVPFTGPR